MKRNQNLCWCFITVIFTFVFSYLQGDLREDPAGEGILLVPEAVVLPIIDGRGEDVCWQNLMWQNIDQVWIPYGEAIDTGDYRGRFKVVWSSQANLLYFLVEVTDDVFVDGFVEGVTSDIYNFDIIEIFIDQDKSGGLHIFDGSEPEWGSNAENAFAYHIYADFPEAGERTNHLYVGDLDGTSWANVISPNYAEHFPTFVLRKDGKTAVWEFSLIIYNDTYEDTRKDSARVKLSVGQIMGLSLAYCDNDSLNEKPKTRDSFFGSVWVPAAAYNDHWKNADYFGKIKLVSTITERLKR